MQPPNVEGGSHHLNTPVQWERGGWTGVDRCRESSLPCSVIPRNYFLDFLERIRHPFCAYTRQLMVTRMANMLSREHLPNMGAASILTVTVAAYAHTYAHACIESY